MKKWDEIAKNLKFVDDNFVLGTGYFARAKKYREKGYSVFSIALFAPKGFESISCFAPNEKLLSDYKKGVIGEDEYIRRYYEENLEKIDPFDMVNKLLAYNNPVVLCYEKPFSFCHRHIISDWLSSKTSALCGEAKI